jgi:hypothetical protein
MDQFLCLEINCAAKGIDLAEPHRAGATGTHREEGSARRDRGRSDQKSSMSVGTIAIFAVLV